MKRWWTALVLVVIPAALVLPGHSQATVSAQPHVAAASPAITLTPSDGKPGETITVNGTGFNCHGGTAVAVVTTTGITTPNTPISCSGGTFSVSFRVPDVSIGSYTVTAKGYTPSQAAAPTDTPVPTDTATSTPTDTPVPSATATATSTPTATATNTVVPTATSTATSAPTATATSTPIPTPTNTPTATPTNTPLPTLPPLPTATPTNTPTPTATPTLVARATDTPTPVGTCTTCACVACRDLQPRSPSEALRSNSRSLAGSLRFDGDQASASLKVTAPSAPFTVRQQSTCTPTPTAGVPTTCTITETVTNNGGHPVRFDQVANQIPSNLSITGQATKKGQIGVHGHQVIWQGFRLAPLGTTTATITVTFTPTEAQAGQTVHLSLGIHANAVDLVTGRRYTTAYGTLRTKVRSVMLPQTGSGGSAPGAAVGTLPQTGGAAR